MTQVMDKKDTHAVASELYAAEATESRTQAQADMKTPDPRPEDAQQAIEEAVANGGK